MSGKDPPVSTHQKVIDCWNIFFKVIVAVAVVTTAVAVIIIGFTRGNGAPENFTIRSIPGLTEEGYLSTNANDNRISVVIRPTSLSSGTVLGSAPTKLFLNVNGENTYTNITLCGMGIQPACENGNWPTSMSTSVVSVSVPMLDLIAAIRNSHNQKCILALSSSYALNLCVVGGA